ncbi:DNA-3-methyladenine glycosylase family protein [Microaceticoccus formicicus]|uniref:DNA-3-methyladenine glycosylase family protein n=1 Tax=Microaceticoccus formicicus TaxID=3118105 RepID=UPI003CD01F36|nr:DNA glycosylase [Peptoniphilaceae bacterium AMB_02]
MMNKLKLSYEGNKVIFSHDEFHPKHILECGQAFRWYKEEDESYTLIAFNRVINVKNIDGNVIINGTNEVEFKELWYSYFDLETDYRKIKSELPINEDLIAASEYGYGIRILNQDIYETIISFIISANNMIPRIKGSIEKISNLYGEKIGEDENRQYYSFPKKEILANANPLDLREKCRVGFRDVRIVEASRMLLQPDFAENKLRELSTTELRKKLIELPGVGPKVSDCIMLFAFGRSEVFPVDVWIKRVMETLFINKEVKPKEVVEYANALFGKNAGYAQQYLFYYGRDNAIGKA